MKSDSEKGKVVLRKSVTIDALPEAETVYDLLSDETGAIEVKSSDETSAESSTDQTAEKSATKKNGIITESGTTEDDIKAENKKHSWNPGKRKLAIIGSSFIALIVVWSVSGMVFAKTTIGADTTLSNRASDQQLLEAMQKKVTAYRLKIIHPDGKTKEYKLENLGISLDNNASITTTRKRQHSLITRLVWWQPVNAEYKFSERTEVMREFITKEIDVSVQPSKDASLTIENGTIKLTESVSGIRYSLENPEQVIRNTTKKLQTEPIKLEKLTQNPDLSEELLKPYKESLEKTLNQPVRFVIGDKTVSPTTAQIASWLEITPYAKEKKLDIRVNSGKVVEYINEIAAGAIRPPRSEVIVKKADGTEQIIVAGVRGLDVVNKNDVATTVSKTLLENKGINVSLPVSYAPYKTVSTGFYAKWIEADITNKRLYVHEYTETVKTILISAGAPATPTVTGQYAIGRKVASQDMRGRNVDGSNYFQPRVPWVMYFYNDYAIHGNYWRPLSYFGNINSSHGCIGMTTADSAWLYDWTPTGTPVIVYK